MPPRLVRCATLLRRAIPRRDTTSDLHANVALRARQAPRGRDALDVRVCCPSSNVQLVGDLLVGLAFGHKSRNAEEARGQLVVYDEVLLHGIDPGAAPTASRIGMMPYGPAPRTASSSSISFSTNA